MIQNYVAVLLKKTVFKRKSKYVFVLIDTVKNLVV